MFLVYISTSFTNYICSVFPGQLIDWQLIFYGTETAPQTSSLNPKAATMIETSSPVTENKKPLGPSTSDDEWKEVSQQTNLSSDIQEDLYENSTHCQHPAKTCLGWCLVIVLVLSLKMNYIDCNFIIRNQSKQLELDYINCPKESKKLIKS